MKRPSSFLKISKLFIIPLAFSAVLATEPSQAATFAHSEGEFKFTNFSAKPLGTRTRTDTNTITIANDGFVDASARAQATFLSRPPQASNLSFSEVRGVGIDYLGNAESQAVVIGNFAVNANKYFSFDFTSKLNLQTSIDNPSAEHTRALGEQYFTLINTDNNSIIDFFTLTGKLNTLGDDDFIAYQKSNNVTLNNPLAQSSFGSLQEEATANIQGSFQRFFTNKTNIALVEVKKNQVMVQAPEPSTNLALLFCSIVGLFTKAKLEKAKGRAH